MKNQTIISSYLMGGLGNQMFQIAKALSEGIINNTPVFFLKNSHTPTQGNQPTKYMSNIFRNVKFVDNLPPVHTICEPNWSYQPLTPDKNYSTQFYGYFQSSKNFKGNEIYIRNIFSPTDEFTEKLKKKFPETTLKNSVSIHVRRGDYLNIPQILPTLDKSYFDKCLGFFEGIEKIYIFSDDKEWCYKNLDYEGSEIVTELEDYEELWMISKCKYNILSNSSFSWWGAYLNDNINKKVLCPSMWFGPSGEKNYLDIYESNWNKIDVEYKKGKFVC